MTATNRWVIASYITTIIIIIFAPHTGTNIIITSHSRLMNRLISVAVFLISAFACYAATPYYVEAIVTDSLGEPEAFATVRVYGKPDTTKVKTLGVTRDNGSVRLNLPAAGSYCLKVFSVGRSTISRDFKITAKEPVCDLGAIIVKSDEKLIGEVTVTATKPLVTKEIDRIGYDVQADEESRTSTLDEMLRKVPLVSVDADGTIKVKGSSDFKIYKNGRPNNSFTKNAKEIFKAIPASMIKKIEVITDPGAREDAEGVGAILNIVTLENTTMKGVMGNVSLNYNTTSDIPSPNIWGSGQIDKVVLSLYAGVSRMSKKSTENRSESETIYDESGNTLRTSSSGRNPGWITWFGIDGSYEMDSLNLFTAEFGGYYYDITSLSHSRTQMTSPDGEPIYSYNSVIRNKPSRYFDINGNFNYQRSTHRRGETLTASYMVSTTNQTQNSITQYSDEINMPVPYTGIVSDFKLDFIEHTFQFDWTRPLSDIHTFDLGAKYIYRDNHSRTRQNYIGFNDEPQLDFTHRTHVAAAYADYRVRLGRLSMRGGLRYEFSRLSASYADDEHKPFASNLSDWVPNAAVSYNINDANTLKLSFGTRINRPGISYLNPAVNSTPAATSQGNPGLGSTRNNSLSLNYSLIRQKINIDLSLGYGFSNGDIVAVQHVENEHLYSTYENAGRNRNFNAGLFMQWTASKKTTLMLNANSSYRRFTNPSLDISNGGWSNHIFTRLSQKLPWKLNAQLSMVLWTGNVNGLYGRTRPEGISMFDYGVSLQRSFLREDRLTVRVGAWNPIYAGNSKYRSESVNLAYYSVSRNYQLHPSSFQISLSWRFGSMNASVKKTNRKISNDDLTGRRSGAE